MGIMDELNNMVIQEVVSGLISHIEDKEMVKEKATEILGHLAKIDDNMVVIIVKLNGVTNIAITKKDNMQDFVKPPDFIDIEAIIKDTIEGIE